MSPATYMYTLFRLALRISFQRGGSFRSERQDQLQSSIAPSRTALSNSALNLYSAFSDARMRLLMRIRMLRLMLLFVSAKEFIAHLTQLLESLLFPTLTYIFPSTTLNLNVCWLRCAISTSPQARSYSEHDLAPYGLAASSPSHSHSIEKKACGESNRQDPTRVFLTFDCARLALISCPGNYGRELYLYMQFPISDALDSIQPFVVNIQEENLQRCRMRLPY